MSAKPVTASFEQPLDDVLEPEPRRIHPLRIRRTGERRVGAGAVTPIALFDLGYDIREHRGLASLRQLAVASQSPLFGGRIEEELEVGVGEYRRADVPSKYTCAAK